MPASKFRAACVQMTSGPVVADNLTAAGHLIREAASAGARFIATPENTDRIRDPGEAPGAAGIFAMKDHPGLAYFSALARELDIWLLIGSMVVKADNDKRLCNRSFLFSNTGELAAHYDKIHLFDVDLATGERHRESDHIKPGDSVVSAQTPWGMLGLSICYDLRFAGLYRALAQKGAFMLSVPSAFTVPTGMAHWETLLRARAIETGSFVLAPAQTGEHAGGRKTWGHSMIVGPWGEVLARAGCEPCVIYADIDPAESEKARASIPSLMHGLPAY